jgi:hypothetical protein
MDKKNNKPSKVAETKHVSSKEYDSRILEVAVKKVLQEDSNLYRASQYYKVPWSILKDNVFEASEHFDGRCNDLKKFEIGKVGRPFSLSFDVQLKLENMSYECRN